ncbi:serine hydrolase, partial [Roseomonas sp. DSM 102946]|nr:serine hydrolase [Roseomonas sp. DSM 102946]
MIALDPRRAAGEARAIAQGWTEAGGPGGAIVLFGPDGVLEGFGGGFASLETRTPFTPDTPNRWASISKQFCTATVLLEGLAL